MSYNIDNTIYSDGNLNVGIYTDISINNSPGKILTFNDLSGRGIVIPNGNVDQRIPGLDASFQNIYLGGVNYNTNSDVFDVYSNDGWCKINDNYLNNMGKIDDGIASSYERNVTRIDFSNNKISFKTDPYGTTDIYGTTPTDKFVIHSTGNVDIGKSDIISDYDPTYTLEVNGAIDCEKIYLNGTLLEPADTHYLSGTTTISNNDYYNINISRIDTSGLTINNCLTIGQTLDISNNLNVNGTVLCNAIYNNNGDKIFINDISVGSVGLPKRTTDINSDLSSIYYNTTDGIIKQTTKTILDVSSTYLITNPTLFSGTYPSGFLDDSGIKSITYDSNWWGFELGLSGDDINALGHIQESITNTGVNISGFVNVTVSEYGSDVFEYYTEKVLVLDLI